MTANKELLQKQALKRFTSIGIILGLSAKQVKERIMSMTIPELKLLLTK